MVIGDDDGDDYSAYNKDESCSHLHALLIRRSFSLGMNG